MSTAECAPRGGEVCGRGGPRERGRLFIGVRGVEGVLPNHRFRSDEFPLPKVQENVAEVEVAIDDELFFARGEFGQAIGAREVRRLGEGMPGPFVGLQRSNRGVAVPKS